jgi:hypothetical protein
VWPATYTISDANIRQRCLACHRSQPEATLINMEFDSGIGTDIKKAQESLRFFNVQSNTVSAGF